MKELEKGVEEVIAELRRREKAQDELLRETREIVRGCSVCIKHIHAGEIEEAEKRLSEVEKLLEKTKGISEGFEHVLSTSQQEYAEAKVLLLLIQGKKVPDFKELGVPFEKYLLGLLDCVGELRREMLEALKKGDKRKAERMFELMNGIYEALLPIRFSESLLPGFRRKQDVARAQVEQARSELLRHG
ncbi:MAG: hypothetical protein QXH27_02315 [Candidatus Micrarchaeia archaeon]